MKEDKGLKTITRNNFINKNFDEQKKGEINKSVMIHHRPKTQQKKLLPIVRGQRNQIANKYKSTGCLKQRSDLKLGASLKKRPHFKELQGLYSHIKEHADLLQDTKNILRLRKFQEVIGSRKDSPPQLTVRKSELIQEMDYQKNFGFNINQRKTDCTKIDIIAESQHIGTEILKLRENIRVKLARPLEQHRQVTKKFVSSSLPAHLKRRHSTQLPIKQRIQNSIIKYSQQSNDQSVISEILVKEQLMKWKNAKDEQQKQKKSQIQEIQNTMKSSFKKSNKPQQACDKRFSKTMTDWRNSNNFDEQRRKSRVLLSNWDKRAKSNNILGLTQVCTDSSTPLKKSDKTPKSAINLLKFLQPPFGPEKSPSRIFNEDTKTLQQQFGLSRGRIYQLNAEYKVLCDLTNKKYPHIKGQGIDKQIFASHIEDVLRGKANKDEAMRVWTWVIKNVAQQFLGWRQFLQAKTLFQRKNLTTKIDYLGLKFKNGRIDYQNVKQLCWKSLTEFELQKKDQRMNSMNQKYLNYFVSLIYRVMINKILHFSQIVGVKEGEAISLQALKIASSTTKEKAQIIALFVKAQEFHFATQLI